MKKLVVLAFIFCALACAISFAGDPSANKSPTLADRTYYFQHRLLPKWTHNSDGAFYEDMMAGSVTRLKEVGAKTVSDDFSAKISVTAYPAKNAVLISFAKPVEPPACYHVLVIKCREGFRFATLEMTEDLFGDGTLTVFGEWTKDGSHLNKGPRKYLDARAFMKEALQETNDNQNMTREAGLTH